MCFLIVLGFFFFIIVLVFGFEMWSHGVKDVLELAIQPRMILNYRCVPLCPILGSAQTLYILGKYSTN